MRCGDGGQYIADFATGLLAEFSRSQLQTWFDKGGNLLRDEGCIAIVMLEDPAFALGHDLLAEFVTGNLVTPVPERPLGKFLDVALMHDGDRAAIVFQRIADSGAH